LAKGGIEPFDEGGIDAATSPLTAVDERLNQLSKRLKISSQY
jgi:hypothetical protein